MRCYPQAFLDLQLPLATRFLQQVKQLEDAEQYIQCFPYLIMNTEAPIEEFYAFYGIEA